MSIRFGDIYLFKVFGILNSKYEVRILDIKQDDILVECEKHCDTGFVVGYYDNMIDEGIGVSVESRLNTFEELMLLNQSRFFNYAKVTNTTSIARFLETFVVPVGWKYYISKTKLNKFYTKINKDIDIFLDLENRLKVLDI